MGTRRISGLEASIAVSCLLREAKQLVGAGHLLAAYGLLGIADSMALTRRQQFQLDGLFAMLHHVVRDRLRRHRLLTLAGRGCGEVVPFRASRSRMPRSIISRS